MAADAPLLTFCQKLEFVVLTMTAISPADATEAATARTPDVRAIVIKFFMVSSLRRFG
jgi:hypothetical protein